MSRRGGEANPKQKKFSRILDYLEVNNKPLYNLYSWMGMQTSLTPKRGGGVTLLVPDKKMIDDIGKLALSDDSEKATDFLSGIIIQDYLGDATAWAEKQDDIPNLLGKRIQVKNVSAGKVVLEGGAELTLDTKAKFLDRVGKRKRDPMAVWIVKGSFDPVDGPDASFKYVGKNGKKKEGGRVRGGLATDRRNKVKDYVSEIERKARDDKDVFAKENAKVCKVLTEKKDDPLFSDLAKLVFELPAWSCVARFYLTFDNEHYIDHAKAERLMLEVQSAILGDDKPKDLVDAFCDLEWTENVAVATKEGRSKLKAVSEREADKLLSKSGLRMDSKIEDVFATYARENRIGSVDNVSFAVVHAVHKAKGGALKQLMCYFDYYMRKYKKNYGLSAAIEFARVSNSRGTELANYLGTFGNWAPGKQLSSAVGAGLVRSDAFFPIARNSSEVMGAGEYDEEEAENPYSREPTNDDALGVEEVSNCASEDFQISKRALNELAAYKAKFGKMPDVQ